MAIIGKIAIAMTTNTTPLRKGLESSASALQSFEATITRTGGVLQGLFAAAAGGAVGLAFKKMISGASHMNETINKTEAIFGKSAGTITAEADRMATAFGTSKNEYINAATSFGQVFKGVGKSQGEAAALGNEFAKLGMDLASFNDKTNEQAFGALQASLRGEFDPLEQFGVFLSADAIKARALAMGLANASGELDDAAKKQATYALILEKTADAQGDLARTADGVGNSTKEFWGRVENLAAAFGETLLPIAGAALQGINTALVALGQAWADNKSAVVDWGSSTLTSLGQATGGVGILQSALNFVADAWDTLKLGFEGFRSFVTQGLAIIVGGFGDLVKSIEWVIEKLTGVKSTFSDTIKAMSDGLFDLSDEQWKGFQEHLAKPWPSESIDRYFAEADAKVKALRDELGNVPKAITAAPTEATKKGKATHAFAGAMLLGSTEAASTILRSRYGTTGKDSQSQVADNTRQTSDKLGRLIELQEQMVRALGSSMTPDLDVLSSIV